MRSAVDVILVTVDLVISVFSAVIAVLNFLK
jgi:hypothetical protein